MGAKAAAFDVDLGGQEAKILYGKAEWIALQDGRLRGTLEGMGTVVVTTNGE